MVLVTAPNTRTARSLTSKVLEARLAACVNLVDKLQSFYWWQGKIESSREVLMLIKTTRNKIAALEKAVVANHPYDTPEFVVLPIAAGNKRYLSWISESVK